MEDVTAETRRPALAGMAEATSAYDTMTRTVIVDEAPPMDHEWEEWAASQF